MEKRETEIYEAVRMRHDFYCDDCKEKFSNKIVTFLKELGFC